MAGQAASRPPTDASLHLVIKVLSRGELDAAVTLLAEGMRENPLHVKAFGAEPQRRQRRLRRFLGQLVSYVHANGTLLGACVHDELIGVLGMLAPGRCRPTLMESLRVAGAVVIGNPPASVLRIYRWLSVWARNDPFEPHAHIGPLAVAQAWRRQGVGRELMMQCCRHLDALGAPAWLETDLAINVDFYEKFGFVGSRQETVLGVPNWFMWRRGSDTTNLPQHRHSTAFVTKGKVPTWKR